MKSSKEIFKDILISAQTNCVLKIKLKKFRNPVITAVDHISKNKIVLKPTCLYGYRLKKRNITLYEIESVTRYQAEFNHPIFERIRFIRNNIRELRRDLSTSAREPSLSA